MDTAVITVGNKSYAIFSVLNDEGTTLQMKGDHKISISSVSWIKIDLDTNERTVYKSFIDLRASI